MNGVNLVVSRQMAASIPNNPLNHHSIINAVTAYTENGSYRNPLW